MKNKIKYHIERREFIRQLKKDLIEVLIGVAFGIATGYFIVSAL